MKKPIAIDLFCGGGGAASGLMKAGFRVIGMDINKNHRKNYPGHFFTQDVCALSWKKFWDYFFYVFPDKKRSKNWPVEFVWASPPCQAFSVARRQKTSKTQPLDLIEITRKTLLSGHRYSAMKYYCIENVLQAPIRQDLILSGPAFGLK